MTSIAFDFDIVGVFESSGELGLKELLTNMGNRLEEIPFGRWQQWSRGVKSFIHFVEGTTKCEKSRGKTLVERIEDLAQKGLTVEKESFRDKALTTLANRLEAGESCSIKKTAKVFAWAVFLNDQNFGKETQEKAKILSEMLSNSQKGKQPKEFEEVLRSLLENLRIEDQNCNDRVRTKNSILGTLTSWFQS